MPRSWSLLGESLPDSRDFGSFGKPGRRSFQRRARRNEEGAGASRLDNPDDPFEDIDDGPKCNRKNVNPTTEVSFSNVYSTSPTIPARKQHRHKLFLRDELQRAVAQHRTLVLTSDSLRRTGGYSRDSPKLSRSALLVQAQLKCTYWILRAEKGSCRLDYPSVIR